MVIYFLYLSNHHQDFPWSIYNISNTLIHGLFTPTVALKEGLPLPKVTTYRGTTVA